MKKQIFLAGGILILLVVTFLIFQFGIKEQAFYKTNFATHTIEKISSDANSMTIGIKAFPPDNRNLENEPSCNVNGLSEITLGGTIGNDDGHVVFGDRNEFYQYVKYPLTNIKVNNVKVMRYWSCSSGNARSQTTDAGMTATLENVTGYCEIQNAYNVNCIVSGGKFRAFYQGQEITGEDGLAYYGITDLTGEFTILKNGIQCVENLQCSKNQKCFNNLCVENLVAPTTEKELNTSTNTLTNVSKNETILITLEEQNLVEEALQNSSDVKTISSQTGISEERVKFILEEIKKEKIDWVFVGIINLLTIGIIFFIIRRFR